MISREVIKRNVTQLLDSYGEPCIPRVYIACPYTHLDSQVMLWRVRISERYAARLIMSGANTFNPISGHYMALDNKMELGFEAYARINEQEMSLSDEVHLLLLEGWQDSGGIQHERNFCSENNIPVKFITLPETPEAYIGYN